MTGKAVLKEALKESKMKQIDLAEHFGVNKATVSTNLRRDNIGLDVFVRYMDAMGYAVMVGKKENDSFVPMWELEREE